MRIYNDYLKIAVPLFFLVIFVVVVVALFSFKKKAKSKQQQQKNWQTSFTYGIPSFNQPSNHPSNQEKEFV